MTRKYDKFDEEDIIEKIEKKFGNIEENKERVYFSTRLKKRLQEMNMTQYELADKIHVRTSTISTYANGISIPKLQIIEKIAMALKVTPNYLLGRTDGTTYSAEQVNVMLGLSSYAMENLYCLKHDCQEFEDLDDSMPISDKYQSHLEILSLIIADKRNLPSILNSLRQYIEKKQEIKSIEQDEKNIYATNEEVENLEKDVIEIKKQIEHFLYKCLNDITNKYEGVL